MSKAGLFKLILVSKDSVVDNASIGFVMESDTATDWSGIVPVCQHVEHFLTQTGTGSVAHAITWYLSTVYDQTSNASICEVYDITGHLNGSAHGSPVAIHNFSVAMGGTARNLPEGVSATVGFRADYGTDVEFGPHTRPRARDRNRVYLPALADGALDHLTTGRTILSANFVTDCLAALFDLSGTVNDSGGAPWNLRVWSRVNAALKLPTVGFMDNRPDYQRRRADPAPGSRVQRALESV